MSWAPRFTVKEIQNPLRETTTQEEQLVEPNDKHIKEEEGLDTTEELKMELERDEVEANSNSDEDNSSVGPTLPMDEEEEEEEEQDNEAEETSTETEPIVPEYTSSEPTNTNESEKLQPGEPSSLQIIPSATTTNLKSNLQIPAKTAEILTSAVSTLTTDTSNNKDILNAINSLGMQITLLRGRLEELVSLIQIKS